MNVEDNTVYQDIQTKTDILIALRVHAQDIINYANKECAFCSIISCHECPMNVGLNEIVCLSTMKLIRK